MNYRKKLIVPPGSKVRLADFDPAFTGKQESHETALPEIVPAAAGAAPTSAVRRAPARAADRPAGPGCRRQGRRGLPHVISAMNPQGCTVTGFKQPTSEDLAHDFLWRVHPHAPGKGEMAIFNRPHYEGVLVVRVHDILPKEVWSKRYGLINGFEKLLVDGGVTILKFFLYISKEEQLERFKQRLDDPARNWKISESDYKQREYWDDYIAAFEDALSKCSTEHAPWFVIPANHKWFRNLAVSQIIAEAMQDLGMKYPEPTVDLAEIRRQYHQAAKSGEVARDEAREKQTEEQDQERQQVIGPSHGHEDVSEADPHPPRKPASPLDRSMPRDDA